jgi:hypothetical protein
MRKLLKVWLATVLAPGFVLAAAPVEAANGVVLVGCDLFARDGPRVEFVQSHGVARRNGDSIRRRFFSGPDFRAGDFEGRDCAEVLSEVVDDGLKFQAMDVFGQDSDLALWFFRE